MPHRCPGSSQVVLSGPGKGVGPMACALLPNIGLTQNSSRGPDALMDRDLATLATQPFDLIVVGGGCMGSARHTMPPCAGFGSDSSNRRFRRRHLGQLVQDHPRRHPVPAARRCLSGSGNLSGERSALLRVAPHLAYPLPIMIPTYGQTGMKGPEGARGRARPVRPARLSIAIGGSQIPIGGYLQAVSCRARRRSPPSPRSKRAGSPAGAALGRRPDLQSPASHPLGIPPLGGRSRPPGSKQRRGHRLSPRGQPGHRRARPRQAFRGRSFTVESKVVVNAAGPWAEKLLQSDPGASPSRPADPTRATPAS